MDEEAAVAVARWAGEAFAVAIVEASGSAVVAPGPVLRSAVVHEAIGLVLRRAEAAFAADAVTLVRMLLEENWEVTISDDGRVVARDGEGRGGGGGCVAADGAGAARGPDEGNADEPGGAVPGSGVASPDGAVRDAGGRVLCALGGRRGERGDGGEGDGRGGTAAVSSESRFTSAAAGAGS